METKNLDNSRGFITHQEYSDSQDRIKRELLEAQNTVKKELTKRLEKAEVQHEKLDSKVDEVRNLVLPLEVGLLNIAENTKQLVLGFAKFTDSQESRNTQFVEKFHANDLKVASIENKTNNLIDRKTYNIGVTAGLLTLAGIFVTGMFQLAPVVMDMILKR